MNKGFYTLPVELLNEDLTKSAIILLSILNSASAIYGYSYANNKYLARRMKRTSRTITNLLKELKDKNYIKIESGNSFKRKIYVTYDFPSNQNNNSN